MQIRTPFGNFSGKTVGITAAVIVFLFILLLLKPFKVISDTEEGVQKSWSGQIYSQPMTAGLHWMNPFNSVTTFPMTYKNVQLSGIGVPAQDGFKTTMDISVTGKFIPGMTPGVLKSTGNTEQFAAVHISKRITAKLIDAGKKYAVVSQNFYDENTLNKVREEIILTANQELEPLGWKVTAVEISNIDLPDVIKNAISESKVRAEQVKRQKESLAIAALKAQEIEKVAESNSKATKMNADAAEYRVKKEADAKVYSAGKEAAGNKEIAASVTPALVDYMNAQAKMKWDGVQPTTVVGGNTPMIMNLK
ncbi:hypothetical protein TacPo2_3 [Pantoea bacteriophage TacPo2]